MRSAGSPRLKPNVLIESRAEHTKLALAEAGLGVAVISTAVQTHRYTLRTVRITYKRKPISEPLAVVWDKRRVLPRYAHDFCELLAAHMHKLFRSRSCQREGGRSGEEISRSSSPQECRSHQVKESIEVCFGSRLC